MGTPSPLLPGQAPQMLAPIQQDLVAVWPDGSEQLASQRDASGSDAAKLYRNPFASKFKAKPLGQADHAPAAWPDPPGFRSFDPWMSA
jgi:hypothetical protein